MRKGIITNNIKTLRKSLRIEGKPVTMDKFAQLLGVSLKTVEAWESQTYTPNTSTIKKMKFMFGWDSNQILQINSLDNLPSKG